MTSTTDRDERLVARARRGERVAIDDLTERFAAIPRIVRICNHRLGRPIAETELGDVTQSALIAIWRKIDGYRGHSSLEAWFYGFCLREVMKVRRRRARRPSEWLAVGGSTDAAARREIEPEPVESDRIETEIDALGPPASEIVRLKHFEERSFSEIANCLDMPLGSVKTQYYRAVERLRVSLAPLWRALQR